jgi:cobalt-zinc-cadmium efflux system outer membrane protein
VLSIARAGRCCTIWLVAIASFPTTAIAEATLPDTAAVLSGPLTLGRALALASQYEPRLRAAGLRSEAARARISDAGRRPNPTLSATEENFGGQLGGGHREATLAIGQAFELGGDRSARTATAEAERDVATAEASIMGREGLARAADRFIAAWWLQARLGRLRTGEALTEQAIRAATERYRAGAAPQLEILRAQSRATAQAVERQRTESDLTIARRELALSWGAVSATFDSLVAPEQVLPGETAGWQSRLSAHPDLTRASAIEALAAARMRAAVAARIPDLTLSGGVRRLEELPGTGFLVGVEVALPLWNRGNGGITAARRELEASVSERRATEQQLEVAFAGAMDRLRAAAARYDTLRLQVRAAREQLVDELLRSYRSGRSSYLDLVAEQSNLLETDLDLVDARADFWRAQIRLELLAGTGLLTPKEAR